MTMSAGVSRATGRVPNRASLASAARSCSAAMRPAGPTALETCSINMATITIAPIAATGIASRQRVEFRDIQCAIDWCHFDRSTEVNELIDLRNSRQWGSDGTNQVLMAGRFGVTARVHARNVLRHCDAKGNMALSRPATRATPIAVSIVSGSRRCGGGISGEGTTTLVGRCQVNGSSV